MGPGQEHTAEFSPTDLVAITAAYDQFMLQVWSCARTDVRESLLPLGPGKTAVAALVALGGFVSAASAPAIPEPLQQAIASIVLSALGATTYRDLPPARP